MIAFINPGLIDLDAALLMGVNAKDSPDAIGYFGTGLKYALATLLRSNSTITIYRGLDCYTIGTETLTTRGKTFEAVTLNNQRLGFTTQLGKTWKSWQAYREIYSNACDEQGYVLDLGADVYIPQPDQTAICIEGDEITRVHNERAWFLLEGTPDHTTKAAELYLKPAKGIFYRGILVYVDGSCANLRYTWNIKDRLELSEDRAAKYLFQIHEAIGHAMDELADRGERDLVSDILCFKDEGFERGVNYNGVFGDLSRSKGFLEITGELMRTRSQEVNPSARLAYARLMNLPENFTGIERMPLTAIQDHQFERACEFCELLGYPVRDYPIIPVERLSGSTLGLAKNGTIYVTKLAFDQGTKQVAMTLIEEYVHLRYGVKDCTREMQDILFAKIANMGEELLLKEPL